MITLYSLAGSCSMASHISLIWSGLPHEVTLVKREDLASPDYRKINPVGSVPAITEGDWSLTQNIAILEYIAEKAGETVNLGANPDAKGRGEFHSLMAFLTSDLHKAMGPIFRPTRFYADESKQDEVRALAVKNLQDVLKTAENRLNGKLYAYQNRKTVADAYLFVILTWVVDKAGGFAGFPGLVAFYNNMYKDSAVQRAAKEEGITLPACK